MKIVLKKLELKNFKGIKELVINFGDVTSISGKNATGKTTVVDAFTWLLFGKDSKDRTTFNIKTLDQNGEELHGLEHSVVGELEVDGQVITLQRLYKEKWTKQRGQAQAELKGHTTEYFINEVPTSMKDYQARVNQIFEESKFKLVTSPLYFTNLKWQDQRAMLLEIIGDIDDDTVINYNPSIEPLRNLLTDCIDNLVKVVKGKISKLKDSVKSIPFRIDECNNSIVDADFEALEFRKRNIQGGIKSLDDSMEDKSKVNDRKLELSSKAYELKQQYQERYNKAKSDMELPKIQFKNSIRELEFNLQDHERDYKSAVRTEGQIERDILENKNLIARLKLENEGLRDEFAKVKSETLEIDENQFICPMCKREFETDDVEAKKAELLSNFNSNKDKHLKGVQAKGKTNNATIAKIETYMAILNGKLIEISEYIKGIKQKLEETKEQINSLSVQLSNFNVAQTITFEGMEELKTEIKNIEEEMNSLSSVDSNMELKVRKSKLISELEEVNKLLAGRENNNKLILRIKELQAEERGLATKIAELEGQQFMCEEFVRTKVELLEGSINTKFAGSISFKLFNKQINGGLNECCEATIEGVPFSNANTASQINAGLSIVNTLCNHFDVHGPIFVDNAESVNEIGSTDSQLIKLIVSLDNTLKVEVES